MNKFKNKIIVVAYNTFNSYGVVRSLGEGGIKPYLVCDNNSIQFVSKSKWVFDSLTFSDKSEVLSLLRDNFNNEEAKPIVICCDDRLQAEVDSHYSELSHKFYLSNCGEIEGEIEKLMDKDIQADIARQSGLIVPQSCFIPVGGSIPEDLSYPCIAKPHKSISGSKSDIRICHNYNQLLEVAGTKDFTVQQFIEKDYEIILWGTSIGNGEYYIPGVTRKIRQFPNEWGMSSFCALESFDKHPGLDYKAIITFLRNLQYTGMFSIEMAVKDGKYYFLEINLRNDGKQYFATAAGANLPLMYCRSLLGLPKEQVSVKLPTFAMGELTDIHHVFRGKISFLTWLRDLFRTKCFFILNFGDLRPFIYQQIKQRFS